MTRLLQWEQINKEVKKFLSALVTQLLLSCHVCEKRLGALNIKQTLQQVHKTLFQDGFAKKSTTYEREAGKGREREIVSTAIISAFCDSIYKKCEVLPTLTYSLN